MAGAVLTPPQRHPGANAPHPRARLHRARQCSAPKPPAGLDLSRRGTPPLPLPLQAQITMQPPRQPEGLPLAIGCKFTLPHMAEHRLQVLEYLQIFPMHLHQLPQQNARPRPDRPGQRCSCPAPAAAGLPPAAAPAPRVAGPCHPKRATLMIRPSRAAGSCCHGAQCHRQLPANLAGTGPG